MSKMLRELFISVAGFFTVVGILYGAQKLFFTSHKPEIFCLGGTEYFEKSQMPVYDRSGHQIECVESSGE